MAFTKVTGPGIHTLAQLQTHNIHSAGIITASQFIGDGSELTGVSGFATAMSNDSNSILNRIFTTGKTDTVAAGTSVLIESNPTAGYIAFTRAETIIVGSGATLTISKVGTGTTLKTNILFDNDGGDADLLDGKDGTYYTDAANITGALPAIDGSSLTNITATTATTATTAVNAEGLTGSPNVVVGVITASRFQGGVFAGDGSGLTGVTASGSGINVNNSGTIIGVAGTINFGSNLDVTAASAGIVTVNVPTTGVTTSTMFHVTGSGSSISSPGTDILSFGTGRSERLRVDSNGKILAGTTASRAVAGGYAKLQVEATSTECISLTRTSDDTGAAYLSFGKTRNGSICQAGDKIGAISWNPDDGTDLNHVSADIYAEVASGIAGDDVPGNLVFGTTADGEFNTTERLRITSSGHIITQGLTQESFNNDGANSKIFEVTGDGTDGEYGVINLSGNQNSSSAVGRINFVNRENSNSASGGNANSRNLGSIDCYADTGDGNAGDDCGGFIRFVTKADGGGNSERVRITSAGNVGVGITNPGVEFEVYGNQTVAQFKGTGGNCFIGLTDVDAGAGIGYIGSDAGDLIFQTPGSSYSTKLQITSAGIIQCGTSGVLKAEINNAVSGHQFISQCSDNKDGFEIYQQHGSTSTRNTLAVYDNRGSAGAKQLSFAVVGDGNIKVPNGNIVMGNTYGIDFSATADGGTVAAGGEILDDYEEGTWTPTLYAWTHSPLPTYDTQSGTYVKIGKQVIANFVVDYSAEGTNSGSYTFIGGLPYNHAGTCAGTLVTWGWAMQNNITWIAGDVSSTNTVVWLSYRAEAANNNTAYMPASELYDNSQVKGTIIYQAA